MRLADLIAQKVKEALDASLKDSEGLLTDVSKAGGDTAAHGMVGDVGSLIGIVSKIVGDIPLIGGLLDFPLKLVEEAEGEGGKMGTALAVGQFLLYFAWNAMEPYLRYITHGIESLAESQIFDPMTAAELVARRMIDSKFGRSEASGGGFDSDHFNLLVESKLTFPATVELLELLRRKTVTREQVIGALEHNGVPGEWITRVLSLERNLLGPADLALALLRGNIDLHFAEGYAAELGVDKADLEILTENTGEPPGLMELLEAYRRGFIDRKRLERGIRQSRVRNEWIDVVEKLRYSPMTVSDAARAVVEHYMDDKEGAKIAQENGLKPEHWPLIRESWGRPLAHEQMLSLYHRGLASRHQVDQAFHESNLKDKYQTQSFELGRRLLPDRLIVDAIKFGALTTKEGAKKLLERGYSTEDTDILLRLGLAEHKSTPKGLTKSEVVSLYQQHLMSKGDTLEHLTKLGYSRHDADLELNLADTKAHAAALRLETTHIRNSFLAGRLSEHDVENQLVQLGVDRGQARHLLSVWKNERGHASRLLTSAQVVKVAEDKLISPEDALDRLIALGYSSGDARKLLVDKGVNPH